VAERLPELPITVWPPQAETSASQRRNLIGGIVVQTPVLVYAISRSAGRDR